MEIINFNNCSSVLSESSWRGGLKRAAILTERQKGVALFRADNGKFLIVNLSC